MPGLNIVTTTGLDVSLVKKFATIQSNMRHDDNYRAKILEKSCNVIIGYSAYDEYPIRFWEFDECFILQEGIIYNRPEKEVNSFIFDIITQNRMSSISLDFVKDFLLKTDGEFIIIIYDKVREELILINDALGRLPIYYYNDKEHFALSREIKFVIEFIPHLNLDKLAIAEYLLFLWSLGSKTFIENVHRLEPAVLLKYNFNSIQLKIQKIIIWNFEDKLPSVKPSDHANNLVRLFQDAIKCRVESMTEFKNLVSLSGGLDSRAVAVALKEIDPEMAAVTYLDYERKKSEDVNVTKELVKKFNLDWTLIKLKKPRFDDLQHLIKLKDGLNYAGMGYLLDYFVKIKRKFGSKVVYYTGDGGDKTLRSLRAPKKIKSVNELIDVIIDKNASAFEISEVTKLLNISREQIENEISNTIFEYPEKDLNQKYVHFVIFERGYKWLFEGEDRNRFYFWSTSPYWSPLFFDYAMKIPDIYKEHLNLHRKFLEKLDKNCLKIKYANWSWIGSLLGSLSYYLLPRIQDIISRNYFLKRIVQVLIKYFVSSGAQTSGLEDKEYDPFKNINAYRQVTFPVCLKKYTFLSQFNKMLNMKLKERKFFALLSIILFLSNLNENE